MTDTPNEPKVPAKITVAKAADTALKATAAAREHSQRAFQKGVDAAGRFNPSTLAWAGIALAAIVLLTSNLLVGTWFKNWRMDLTEDGLYSISPSTRKVLGSIDEPINVQVYYTKALGETAPVYGAYFERVRALLERYRDLSRGKLQVQFINPLAFSDAEDRAVASGLKGIRLNSEGDQAYFGLVATNTTDNAETVGFFSPDRERFLEYDLTKLVHTLSKPKKKVVGLISGLPLEGGPGSQMTRGQPMPPWAILGQIRDFFELKSLQQDVKEIPADIDTLMLVQPSGLTPEAAYAIDQFALKGGRILAFVDPVPEVGRVFSMGQPIGEITELKKLIASWGVTFDSTKVAGDKTFARRVQFGGGQGGQPSVTDYVAWMNLDKRALDEGDALSGGIDNLNIASPGILSATDKATTKLQPIVQTSDQAAVIDADKISLRPDPISLLRGYKPGGKRLTIAARVTGDFKSAFPDGPPKPVSEKTDGDKAEGDKAGGDKAGDQKAAEAKKVEAMAATAAAEAKATAARVTTGKLNAIIFADSDFLHDQFWVDEREFLGQKIQIPLAHNAVFVVNAIENLTGGEALRDLRGRGVKPRPFVVVDDIRRGAEQVYREKEQALEGKLKETQAKLTGLEQRGGEGGNVILTDKDRETIEKFRTEMLSVRRELRDVKLGMRKGIDQLDSTLKFANIAAVPLLIGLGAIGLAIMRRRSDRAARPEGARTEGSATGGASAGGART